MEFVESITHNFKAKSLRMHLIIMKIDHMILSWISVVSKGKRTKLEDSMMLMRHSREFIGSHTETGSVSGAGDEASI